MEQPIGDSNGFFNCLSSDRLLHFKQFTLLTFTSRKIVSRSEGALLAIQKERAMGSKISGLHPHFNFVCHRMNLLGD